MLADYVANQEEAEASAFDLDGVASGNAVEAVEDAFVLVRWKTEAGIGNAEGGPSVVRDGERTADVGSVGGVFDGIVEEVDDGGAEVVGDALNMEPDGAGDGFEDDAVGLKVVTLEGDGDAVGDEGVEVDEGAVLQAMPLTQLAGFEDLLDGGEEAVGVGEHDLVELLFLLFRGCPALEGFKVEADAGDGGFELVGDGVEEGVLTLVTANLTNEEDGVEHDAGDDEQKENRAKDGEGKGTLVPDDPADVEGDETADDERAKGDIESDSSAASSDVHGLEAV